MDRSHTSAVRAGNDTRLLWETIVKQIAIRKQTVKNRRRFILNIYGESGYLLLASVEIDRAVFKWKRSVFLDMTPYRTRLEMMNLNNVELAQITCRTQLAANNGAKRYVASSEVQNCPRFSGSQVFYILSVFFQTC